MRELGTEAELNELKLSPDPDPDAEEIRQGSIRLLKQMLPKEAPGNGKPSP